MVLFKPHMKKNQSQILKTFPPQTCHWTHVRYVNCRQHGNLLVLQRDSHKNTINMHYAKTCTFLKEETAILRASDKINNSYQYARV